jgi:cytochrome c
MLGDAAPRWVAVTVGLALASLGSPARAADPAAGKSVFNSYCSICHSAQPGKNMVGPSLFGVVGRKTGSVPGFHYSPANQNANLTWDPATLDKYLQSPRTVIPGTTMTYGGLKDDTKRSDLIAYLATLK